MDAASGSAWAPGHVVSGRYVVERVLGRGGMGVVYAAEDRKLGRRVALKTLTTLGPNGATALARLRGEAETIAGLAHPGIVAIFDILDDDGELVLVMELVGGVSLRARLAAGLMAPPEAVRIVREAASALAAAHARGLVHRDVKPDNVMIREDGRASLLDFGIAKAVTTDPHAKTVERAAATGAGALVGTPAYMSPEQAEGLPVGPATDQFALAVTAYELLTGDLPWPSQSVGRLLAAILDAPPVPVRNRRTGLDDGIERVFERALAKKPAERYESIEAFGSAFADALAEASPSVREGLPSVRAGHVSEALTELAIQAPSGTTGRPVRASRARSRAIAVAGVVLVVVAAVVASRFSNEGPAPAVTASSAPAPSAAVIWFSNAPFTPSLVPAATEAYQRAMKALEDLDYTRCEDLLIETLKADPTYPSAHLELTLLESYRCPADLPLMREHLASAQRARATLNDRERDVLDAIAPAVLDPPNLVEVARRFRALSEQRPLDVPLLDELGVTENKLFHFDASAAAYERALALEPRMDATIFAQDLASVEQRNAVLDHCVGVPGARLDCRSQQAVDDWIEGSCGHLEQVGRDMAALAPDQPRPHRWLAWALAGQGAPVEAIGAALARKRALAPGGVTRTAELGDAADLALWTGDFATALRDLDELLAGASDAALPGLALKRVEALWEIGDKKGAGHAALAYVKRAAALPKDERPDSDVYPLILARARQGGELEEREYVEKRDAWVAQWKARLDPVAWEAAGPIVWARAFAHAEGDEARRAVARAPEFAGLPPARSIRFFYADDGVPGDTLRHAGRLDDALPRLESAAAKCDYGVARVRAKLALGEVLEEHRDNGGACKAYMFVLERWAAARPRSVTAEEAKAHAARLGCGR